MNQVTSTSAPLPSLDLGDLPQRLIERGMLGLPVGEQISGFCRKVVDSGFPMKRVSMGMYTLHPRYGSQTFTWRPEMDGIEYIPRERSVLSGDVYLKSPVHHMRSNGLLEMRRRLDEDDAEDFALFSELRAEGLVDYAAHLVPYDPSQVQAIAQRIGDAGARGGTDVELNGIFFSCATDLPQGFDDGQLTEVFEALPYLAISVKSRLTYDVASTVLETYLGRDAGRRVLTGEIERGTAEAIRAGHLVCRPARFHQTDRQSAA